MIKKEATSDLSSAFDTDLADAVSAFTATRQERKPKGLKAWQGDTAEIKTLTYSGRGVFCNYADSEIDGNTIQRSDMKLIALQDETEQAPVVDDIINGYRALSVSKDPANVTWVIQLRRV